MDRILIPRGKKEVKIIQKIDELLVSKQVYYNHHPDMKSVKKILVIKLRHLGDVLLTGPVFRALKENLPEASIDAYIYKEAIPMLAGHPSIDHWISYDRNWKQGSLLRRMQHEIAILREIKQRCYDMVINLTEGDRGVIVAWVSRAKIRVGFRPKGKWQQQVLTHIVKECPSPRHTVERHLDVLRRIGIFPSLESRELSLYLPEAARKRARLLSGGEAFVLIHPASRWRFKCWPIQNMRQLVENLLRQGRKVILTSGPDFSEQEMMREIAQGLDLLNLSGAISLEELGALIELSALLICVDSVPLHMASALKKPVVALFGPTSEVTWGPWRNPNAIVVSSQMSCRPCYLDGCGGSKRSDCLESLSVAAVLRAVHAYLKV